MSKFIATSRQATEMDKTRILLETRIQEVKDDCKGWAEVAIKAKNEVKELQNMVEELKTDIVEKDIHLDYLQKRNDELSTLLNKAEEDTVVEFRASKQFTDLLDTNYTARFEDFRMDAMENFPKVTLAPSSSTLVLQALFSRWALKMLISKMMPLPSLLRTSPMLEMTPHNENVKF